jgi:sterol-4alpha-carboxylate 3-dehydrogenase (decarboxylating)
MNLVIGGAGFTGGQIVRALLAKGQPVRCLDLRDPGLAGCEVIRGDLRSPEVLDRACRGVDTVFHTACVYTQHPGCDELVWDVNVVGTRRILDACRAHRVSRLVFTSSIDVVFGGHPISGGDETMPYTRRFFDGYSRSKVAAEQAVLAANERNLLTCAIRPGGIFGPGDRARFRVVVPYARHWGFARMGDGRARFAQIYVDNLAWAHLLAAERLQPGSPVCGQAYFVADHEPMNFFDFMAPLLEPIGIRTTRHSIPFSVLWPVAQVHDTLYRAARHRLKYEPSLTRYSVAAVCHDYWFRIDKAIRDLAFAPIVPFAEAYERTRRWVAETFHGRPESPLRVDLATPELRC